jgi:hypothetical protein
LLQKAASLNQRVGSVISRDAARFPIIVQVTTFLSTMRDIMRSEPLHVSARFHAAVFTAAIELEQQAALDEQMISTFENADQRRRHRLLVDAQLLRAFKLREMMKQMRIREEHFRPVQKTRSQR